ncbi:MAG: 1-(5-phosphoribosyl)-5-[(5-phosphoribosylamino)methylideneamino]imidazole-4-carboxamide isomerase [Chloroflexota bacterium]|nr:1-(5-phosphoribosyl)-5-[(5-phosphoribosylamino)methylideneamino]imidazole-4-carboxamide isomerase [Chloroflexota bacterium]
MIVYPAIDIRGGKAVRLIEGDFSRETVFDADPADAARRWESAGAKWIHIVDLDGARTGIGASRDAIARIKATVSCKLQVGGGIRSMEDIDALLGSGIDRVILGSIAVTSPETVVDAVRKHGDRIAVGLDAREGKLATSGWETQTKTDAFETASQMGDQGVRHIIFTDIRRDGTLAGPNVAALTHIVQSTSAGVIASGGIGSTDDVLGLRQTGVEGVIIGRALYDGRIDLADLVGRLTNA